jgi:hypothetical protein
MRSICYRNTKTTLPGWREALHEKQPLGFAYETTNHFVHFYGRGDGLYTISPGLTVIEGKSGSLENWVVKVFGATNIENSSIDIGCTIEGIWRPGLYFQDEIYNGLNVDKFEQRASEQALRILIEKLDDLLLYIEPEGSGLLAYGHKTRELLIIACTEVENQWKSLIDKSGATPINGRTYTTQDYVRLYSKAHLGEYRIHLRNYNSIPPIIPFCGWSSTNPTQSLSWYDSYNKTKHDRDTSFSESSLHNVLQAVVANIAMFCVRFGPIQLLQETKTLSSLVNQTFEIDLFDCDINSFYIPKLELPADTRTDLFIYDSHRNGHYGPWNTNKLKL